MSKINKVAVIGTGVIGVGWIIRCLAHNKIVYAFDKDIKLKKNLILEIKRTWPFVKKLFNKKKLNLKNFHFFTSIEETLNNADFIQECATENYSLKTKLMNIIGKYAKPNSIISSSSCLGKAPCAICGCSPIGQNNIEGILRIPKAAASSCSASVSIL